MILRALKDARLFLETISFAGRQGSALHDMTDVTDYALMQAQYIASILDQVFKQATPPQTNESECEGCKRNREEAAAYFAAARPLWDKREAKP